MGSTDSVDGYFNGVPLDLEPSSSNGTGAAANGSTAGSALPRDDYDKFVRFFRRASPYIEGHRGRTFVIVIPGGVRAPTSPHPCRRCAMPALTRPCVARR